MKTNFKFNEESPKMTPEKWKVVEEMKEIGYTDKEIGLVFQHCLEMMQLHTEETEIVFAKDCKRYEEKLKASKCMPKK